MHIRTSARTHTPSIRSSCLHSVPQGCPTMHCCKWCESTLRNGQAENEDHGRWAGLPVDVRVSVLYCFSHPFWTTVNNFQSLPAGVVTDSVGFFHRDHTHKNTKAAPFKKLSVCSANIYRRGWNAHLRPTAEHLNASSLARLRKMEKPV